jgi:uncharacterized membrane protein YbhN (UPF0104 family)
MEDPDEIRESEENKSSLASFCIAAIPFLAAASLLSRNLSRFGLPAEKQEQRIAATRLWIVLLSILAFGLWVFARTTLVGLLLSQVATRTANQREVGRYSPDNDQPDGSLHEAGL